MKLGYPADYGRESEKGFCVVALFLTYTKRLEGSRAKREVSGQVLDSSRSLGMTDER